MYAEITGHRLIIQLHLLNMTSETAKRKISSCVSSVYKAKVDFCADFEYDIDTKVWWYQW